MKSSLGRKRTGKKERARENPGGDSFLETQEHLGTGECERQEKEEACHSPPKRKRAPAVTPTPPPSNTWTGTYCSGAGSATQIQAQARRCTHAAVRTLRMPSDFPYSAKVVCLLCGRFLCWVARPAMRFGKAFQSRTKEVAQ
jgi:hypothetical protein